MTEIAQDRSLLDSDTLMATVIGWRCCSDIPLPRTAADDRRWEGAGHTAKDGRGYRFEMALESGGSLQPPRLEIRISGEGTGQFGPIAGIETADGGWRFEFDAEGAFGEPDDRDGIDRRQLTVRISGKADLKSQFRNYAFGLSYMAVVRDLYRDAPAPDRILEWGPGRSTLFFAESFPGVTIDGVEHHEQWFERCQLVAEAFPGVAMHLRRLAIAPGRAEGYVTWPLYGGDRYDLIFIDGRLRCDCAAVAALVLAPGGTVLIHDAHRANYRPAYRLFRSRRIVCDTAILRDPEIPWRQS